MRTYIIILATFFFSAKIKAQNDTIFVDNNLKNTPKEAAVYYRLKKNNNTGGHCSFEANKNKSLYVINYYYVKNNKPYFEGYSTDENGKHLTENAFYNPLIFNINYSIANKSLLTGGLEFCLDCKDENKLFLGAGYGVTNSYNGNYYGLPDVHLSYSKELLFIKTGSSNKNAYAIGGFTFLNRFDLGFGYSFPYNNEKIPAYKGFTTSLTLRLTKNEKAYQKFNMIQ